MTRINVSGEFLFVIAPASIQDEALLQLTGGLAREGDRALSELKAELEKVAVDGNLTELGRHARRLELAKQTVDLFKSKAQANLEKVRTAMQVGEGRLLAPQIRQRLPEGVDKDDARALEREAREYLRSTLTDPVERSARYRQALQENDVQTIRAFELAPAVAPLISAGELRAGGELWASTHHSAEFRVLEQQRTVIAHLQHAAAWAEEMVGDMIGVEKVGRPNDMVILPESSSAA